MSLAPPDDHKVGRDASASVVSNSGSPSGSPVSSPRSRPKPGLFHSLKQKIFTGQHTSDPEYENGRQHFTQLHDALLRIQTQAKNYITNVRGLITSAHQVSDEFHLLFNEGGHPHAYVGLIAGMNSGHDTLANDATLNPFLEQINTTVMRKLTEELEHHRAIQARMADRDQVKADVDYYHTKVDKLRIDREKRASAGKVESNGDREKFTRNQQKLTSVQTEYKDLNDQLIAELHRMWNDRQHTLGPIVTDFLAIERQLVSLYSTAIQNIPGPDPNFVHKPYVHNAEQKVNGLSDVPLNGVVTPQQSHVDAHAPIEVHQQQQPVYAAQQQQPVYAQSPTPNEYAAVPVQQQHQPVQHQPEYAAVYQPQQVIVTPEQQQQPASTNPFETPVSAANGQHVQPTEGQHVQPTHPTHGSISNVPQQQQQQYDAQALAAQQQAQAQAYAQQQQQQQQQPAQVYAQQPQQVATSQMHDVTHGQQQPQQVLTQSNDGIASVVAPSDAAAAYAASHAIPVVPSVQVPAASAPEQPTYSTPSGLPVPVQYGESGAVFFDFPRATTPAPPLPERTHPKHARAQSLGQQISTKTNTTSQTARRTKSTFTSPKHQVAILPTHVEKSTSTVPSTAFTSSTTSTTTLSSTANTSVPLISPPTASSSAPNSPHSRNRKTKRNASISGNSKSISSITSPSGRVRLAITPRGEPKQIIHPLHVAPSYSQPIAPTPITIPQTTSTPITIPQTTSTPVTPQSTLAAPSLQNELSQSRTPNSHSSIAPSTPEPFFSNFQPPEPTPLNAPPTTNDPSILSNHQITPFDDPS